MFEFEIEAPKSLRISVVPSHTRIAVDIRLRVRSPGPVEFRKDGLNLGYRLYDAHSELLFEGRAFSTPTPFLPGHWAPLRLQIPVSCIRYDYSLSAFRRLRQGARVLVFRSPRLGDQYRNPV
jgi:hypothetical protein